VAATGIAVKPEVSRKLRKRRVIFSKPKERLGIGNLAKEMTVKGAA